MKVHRHCMPMQIELCNTDLELADKYVGVITSASAGSWVLVASALAVYSAVVASASAMPMSVGQRASARRASPWSTLEILVVYLSKVAAAWAATTARERCLVIAPCVVYLASAEGCYSDGAPRRSPNYVHRVCEDKRRHSQGQMP